MVKQKSTLKAALAVLLALLTITTAVLLAACDTGTLDEDSMPTIHVESEDESSGDGLSLIHIYARVRPVPHDVSRFRDASEVELPEQAEQGKLFPLTETIELGDPAQEPAPSYDEDYKKLSEKIEKGELDFNEETENEGQISIVDELLPDELKVGTGLSLIHI